MMYNGFTIALNVVLVGVFILITIMCFCIEHIYCAKPKQKTNQIATSTNTNNDDLWWTPTDTSICINHNLLENDNCIHNHNTHETN